ncbi:MAG: hypothetical protein ACE5HQ_05370 [Gemmatimonadota bacterium]
MTDERSPSGGRDESLRRTYVAATAVLSGIGAAIALRVTEAEPAPIISGAVSAWAVQAVSFWRLVGVLARESDAARVWILGMGARFGGLAVAFAAGSWSRLDRRELLLSYGIGMLLLLLLESGWLMGRRRSF